VAREGGLGGDASRRRVGLDAAVVLAAREAREAPADGAVAGGQLALLHRLKLADARDPVAGEAALQRRADAPEQADRPLGEERERLGPADDREAARLVEVGGDLGEELVVAEPDRDGDADLALDAAGKECKNARRRPVGPRLAAA